MLTMLHSKKFVAFLIGLIVLACKNFLDIDEATATKIAGIIGTYLLGQGVADGLSGGMTSSLPGTPTAPPNNFPNG